MNHDYRNYYITLTESFS